MGHEKVAGFVAQELQQLMIGQRHPESLCQRGFEVRQTLLDETAGGVGDCKLCRMPDAGSDFHAPVAMHRGRRARRGTSVGQYGIAPRRIEKVLEQKEVEVEHCQICPPVTVTKVVPPLVHEYSMVEMWQTEGKV